MFAVLRHGAFRWIWAGALLSNTGNWMEAVAQSWLVQQQTSSPFMVELLAASEFLPHAVLMLAAGWLADHYDRRKLLLAGQVAMMVLGAVLAVAAHLGLASPWVVIALSFAEGAAWASSSSAVAVALAGPWLQLAAAAALPPIADISAPAAVPAAIRASLNGGFLGIDDLYRCDRPPPPGYVGAAEDVVRVKAAEYVEWLEARG